MGYLKEGQKIEDKFSTLFENIKKATVTQDMNDHWDVEISYKIDVKSLKKLSRSDEKTNENYHWVEIRGVKDGGWLYSGKASHYAFETEDYWVVVSKEALKDLIREKVEKTYVANSWEALYKLYSRAGRTDIITIVKTIDLMARASQIINKNGNKEN